MIPNIKKNMLYCISYVHIKNLDIIVFYIYNYLIYFFH